MLKCTVNSWAGFSNLVKIDFWGWIILCWCIYCTVHYRMLSSKEQQVMPPQNMPLWYTDYFERQALAKQQMRKRLSLNFPYLPKDRFPKRNSFVIHTPPQGSFINQERLTHHSRGDEKLIPHLDKLLSQTNTSSTCPSLKSSCSLLRGPHLHPLPFPYYDPKF